MPAPRSALRSRSRASPQRYAPARPKVARCEREAGRRMRPSSASAASNPSRTSPLAELTAARSGQAPPRPEATSLALVRRWDPGARFRTAGELIETVLQPAAARAGPAAALAQPLLAQSTTAPSDLRRSRPLEPSCAWSWISDRSSRAALSAALAAQPDPEPRVCPSRSPCARPCAGPATRCSRSARWRSASAARPRCTRWCTTCSSPGCPTRRRAGPGRRRATRWVARLFGALQADFPRPLFLRKASVARGVGPVTQRATLFRNVSAPDR